MDPQGFRVIQNKKIPVQDTKLLLEITATKTQG